MKLDQFGMSGLGALFTNLNQPAQTVMPAVNGGGGGENIAVGLGGGSLTPSISTGSGSGATASPTTSRPTTLSPTTSSLMEAQQDIARSVFPKGMPFPGLPNPLPSPSPLSGLEFFLQKLAMQDQASASQDKIKGLMSGIQTLISNEFPNADFEGGGGPSITTLMGKY